MKERSSFSGRKLLLGVVMFFMVFSPLMIAAQDNKPVYVYLNYMKVDRGKGTHYVDLIKNNSMKLWEERVKTGEIHGWYLVSVVMSADGDPGYNYVSVIVSNSINSFFDPKMTAKDMYKKLVPGISDQMYDNLMQNFSNSRVFVKQEVYQYVNGFNLATAPSKYTQLDFMKVPAGKENDYVKMETETYMPLHKERGAQGYILGWGVYSKIMPYADNAPYNFLTTQDYNDIGKSMEGNYSDLYKKVFPKGDINKMSAQTNAARALVKQELWRTEVAVDATTIKK